MTRRTDAPRFPYSGFSAFWGDMHSASARLQPRNNPEDTFIT